MLDYAWRSEMPSQDGHYWVRERGYAGVALAELKLDMRPDGGARIYYPGVDGGFDAERVDMWSSRVPEPPPPSTRDQHGMPGLYVQIKGLP